ncbi:uncharacterized protein L3040_005579 [Drepanopeziza brunnea f. sp. 'multigermtubi']|uniref:Serine-threonine rich protein n=1 Tax=Marssonina brunnea f. sp. multigermtubi (strain MB_m1) TaxID=1072389 RepID=K1WYU4_MARBU|nr:serine-threonine rich protein [Drepanopeziza brunnea f. sp. 'multigermtubi' MB_m1]EKD13803.1 serine-threonine rich protein [Drepanopeziza brunnea f. sp. 'multigermtubi' MB_m1]KAJ5041022.1 hypothetical protein L3040_005579 [Drepanopeziza brunnea f. sp. 'multigermtubi']
MRFSAITALCAAPLVLAGSSQAELAARAAFNSGLIARHRGASVEVIQSSSSESSGSKSDSPESKGNSNANNNKGSAQANTHVTEVIIIWVNQGGNAPTQTLATTASVAAAPAATHTVIVGGAGGLVYTPATLAAAVGDMVIFEFYSQNHTATQSAFTTPCDPLAGGMDSGFIANVNNTVNPAPQMAMQVTVDTPLWFYCKQKGHCGKGMVFSINPSLNKTQAKFQQMAIAQKGTGTPAVIAGGGEATPAASGKASAVASASTPTASAGTSMVGGTGSLNTAGACSCSCLCGVAAFPDAAVQGVGAFGGIAGAMPMSELTE